MGTKTHIIFEDCTHATAKGLELYIVLPKLNLPCSDGHPLSQIELEGVPAVDELAGGCTRCPLMKTCPSPVLTNCTFSSPGWTAGCRVLRTGPIDICTATAKGMELDIVLPKLNLPCSDGHPLSQIAHVLTKLLHVLSKLVPVLSTHFCHFWFNTI